MTNLIFFGAPGAGKGTQAKKVCKKFNLIHLSTGDILRAKIADKTEMGILAKNYMDKGELVPDEVIIKMVENVIKENPKSNGFIFDGFPRTIAQAEAFDIMLANLKMSISYVIHFKVDKEELVKRLKKRAEIENREDDSNISIIENRIAQYIEKTAPVKEYYSNQGKLKKVEGVGNVDEIFEKVVETIS